MVREMQSESMVASHRGALGARPGVGAVLRALVLGAALLVPGRAVAEPVTVADGALRVEVAAGIDDAERMPGWIAERHPDLARKLAEGPGRVRWIGVEVEGEYLDFRYRVVAMRDGEAVGGVGDWVACSCSNDDLLMRLDEGIAAAVERLRTPVAAAVGETPAVPEGHPPRPSPAAIAYRRMTGLGTAGIVVGALGLSGVVVGGVFLGVGERVPAGYGHLERDYHPPGVAMLVSGGVLLGAGVGLLVTDLVQCRNEHRRCALEGGGSASAVVVRPWFGARGVGLAGRF
jgi:hypothetical protein